MNRSHLHFTNEEKGMGVVLVFFFLGSFIGFLIGRNIGATLIGALVGFWVGVYVEYNLGLEEN